MSISLVVLAAGIGSRYGGLKQMDPVGPSGEFILDYSVYDAKMAGFSRIVFVIREEIRKAFVEVIGSRIAPHIPVEYVCQDLNDVPAGFTVPGSRAKPWGTAHAIRACRAVVDEPFAVINADDLYGREGYQLLGGFLSNTVADAGAYGMVGFRLSRTLSDHGSVARGICQIDEAGYLQTVVERTSISKTADGVLCEEQALTGDECASMNMWAFKPSLFEHLETAFEKFLAAHGEETKSEFFIPTVVDHLISCGQVTARVLETSATWFGVTNPDDRPLVVTALRQLVDAGEYPVRLWT